MPRSRANDAQLDKFQDKPSKRACGKASHGQLEKGQSLEGDTIWYCPRCDCNYKEDEKGRKI